MTCLRDHPCVTDTKRVLDEEIPSASDFKAVAISHQKRLWAKLISRWESFKRRDKSTLISVDVKTKIEEDEEKLIVLARYGRIFCLISRESCSIRSMSNIEIGKNSTGSLMNFYANQAWTRVQVCRRLSLSRSRHLNCFTAQVMAFNGGTFLHFCAPSHYVTL